MKIFKDREDDLVTLATFQDPTHAHALRTELESIDISAAVSGEESNAIFGVAGLGASGLVGVQVLVQRADLKLAQALMSESPAPSESSIAAWTCACGESVDEGFAVCWSCGEDHQPPE